MTHLAPRGRHDLQTLGPRYAAAPTRRQNRRRLHTLLGLGGLVGPIVLIAAGCSSGGASAATVNGTVIPSSSSGVTAVFGPGINATTYAGCA
jgi:hypothetical protein